MASGGSEGGVKGRDDRKSIPDPARLRLNVLCIIGATTGVAAIALPWAGTAAGPFYEEKALAAWIRDLMNYHSFVYEFFLAFGFFVAGTVLAFFTPAGGVPQVIGLVGFLSRELERQESLRQGAYYEGQFAVGFVVACLSASLVLISAVRPMGPGFDGPSGLGRSRFKVISGIRPLRGPEWLVQGFRRHRPWLLAWAISALLLSVFVLASEPELAPREPLSQIEGGVQWLVDFRIKFPLLYNSSYMTMSDGQSTASWLMSPDLLGNDTWGSESFGERDIPGLTLELIIVDFCGDGRLGPGDILSLVATNSTSFADDVTYQMRFSWPYNLGINSGARNAEILFEFHEGSLDSKLSVSMPQFIL